MDGFSILNLFSFIVAPLISVAAPPSATQALPTDTDLALLATSQIYQAQFSTDLETQQTATPSSAVPLAIFTYGGTPTSLGEQVFRLIVRNESTTGAENVTLISQAEPPVTKFSANPRPQHTATTAAHTEFSWPLPNIPPGQFTTIDIRLSGNDASLFSEVHYETAGQSHIAGTSRVAQAEDRLPEEPQPVPSEAAQRPSPQPAIICDPAETGCVEIIPNLGVNFQRVRQQDSRPIICSGLDPRGCTEQRPTLGERFREAVAVVEPGECRVAEDARIAEPAFHDSFLRKTEPAAVYLRPLFDSGQDFKLLVHQTSIDHIKHLSLVRKQLFPIWLSAWREHETIVQKVRANEISGVQAVADLKVLLDRLKSQVTAEQTTLGPGYSRLEDRYDEAAQKAVANARTSIQRACGEVNGEDEALRLRLEEIKQTIYLPLIISFEDRYTTTTEPTFATLSALQQYWESELYPALEAYDGGATGALNGYNSSQTLSLFDVMFAGNYIAHTDLVENNLESFRLTQWEIALDTPKTRATECEFQNVVVENIQDVEETVCESGTYPEGLARTGEGTTKGQLGILQPPPDLSGQGSSTAIDPAQVIGQVCGGRPGDPFWAPYNTDSGDACPCHCGEEIDCPSLGKLTACELCPDTLITMHDIYVDGESSPDVTITAREECLQEVTKHGDPFL